MVLIEETFIGTADLPVALMKDHLRLGSGFADDGLQNGLVESYLRASLATIEGRIGKALIARRFRWEVSAWRGTQAQALPVAPVAKVLSVTLVGEDGSRRAVDGWRLERDTHRPRIVTGFMLPEVPMGGFAEVVFEAGFGDWHAVPADLAQAVLLLAGEYYENRHEAGTRPAGLPAVVVSLIERWRTVRVLGGGCGMKLNRSLVLEAPMRIEDGAGGYRDEWAALGLVWAVVKAGSGRELAGVEVAGPQVSYRITVRAAEHGAPSRPKAGQRLREGARLFQILAVTEADDTGRHLICFAREGMA